MSRFNKKFGRRQALPEDMVLQIATMADVFVILLVFLLKTFSTGASSISPTADVTIPVAETQDQISESLKIEISEKVIIVDEKPVVDLNNFRFSKRDLESDGTPRDLNKAFIVERSKKSQEDKKKSVVDTLKSPQAAESEKGLQQTDEANKILVIADEKVPYSTLKTVLDAAANNGYQEFKLVVLEDK